MRKYGLIGYPLGHSFSKKYFTEKFLRENIRDCSYENYPLTSIRELPELISSENDLCGLNVTIPYKSEVIKYIDEVENEAAQVGAVNVLKIKQGETDIRICGYNSDITGIKDSLLPLLNQDVGGALVLGTGGSSKAVCHVLTGLNLNYTLISRYPKPGCLTYSEINETLLKRCRLIINTTPLGMYPHIEGKPDINYDQLTEDHILFDLVYNPLLTTFLRLGKEKGTAILNGLKMLQRQAETSGEIWNDDNA